MPSASSGTPNTDPNRPRSSMRSMPQGTGARPGSASSNSGTPNPHPDVTYTLGSLLGTGAAAGATTGIIELFQQLFEILFQNSSFYLKGALIDLLQGTLYGAFLLPLIVGSANILPGNRVQQLGTSFVLFWILRHIWQIVQGNAWSSSGDFLIGTGFLLAAAAVFGIVGNYLVEREFLVQS